MQVAYKKTTSQGSIIMLLSCASFRIPRLYSSSDRDTLSWSNGVQDPCPLIARIWPLVKCLTTTLVWLMADWDPYLTQPPIIWDEYLTQSVKQSWVSKGQLIFSSACRCQGTISSTAISNSCYHFVYIHPKKTCIKDCMHASPSSSWRVIQNATHEWWRTCIPSIIQEEHAVSLENMIDGQMDHRSLSGHRDGADVPSMEAVVWFSCQRSHGSWAPMIPRTLNPKPMTTVVLNYRGNQFAFAWMGASHVMLRVRPAHLWAQLTSNYADEALLAPPWFARFEFSLASGSRSQFQRPSFFSFLFPLLLFRFNDQWVQI
jgi:hypothetical protein